MLGAPSPVCASHRWAPMHGLIRAWVIQWVSTRGWWVSIRGWWVSIRGWVSNYGTRGGRRRVILAHRAMEE